MSAIQTVILVTNHSNWELNYGKCERLKVSYLAKAIFLAVASPLFFVGSAFLFPVFSYRYAKIRWEQYKIVSILSNPQQLEDYSKKRITICENQIKDLRIDATRIFKRLQNPAKIVSSWEEFEKKDFYEKSLNPECVDKVSMKSLEEIRVKLKVLSSQKKVLSQANENLEIITKIAEMSFIKKAIKRQRLKENMVGTFFGLTVIGYIYRVIIGFHTNDRTTFEGNKNFLPAGTGLQNYDDLIDAHNNLIRNHDFLVPFITRDII